MAQEYWLKEAEESLGIAKHFELFLYHFNTMLNVHAFKTMIKAQRMDTV